MYSEIIPMPKAVDETCFLEYFSRKIIKITIPVMIALLCDALLTRFLEQTHGSASLDRSFSETMSYSDGGVDPLNSLWIALICSLR